MSIKHFDLETSINPLIFSPTSLFHAVIVESTESYLRKENIFNFCKSFPPSVVTYEFAIAALPNLAVNEGLHQVVTK